MRKQKNESCTSIKSD